MTDLEREKRTRQHIIGIRLAIQSRESISSITMSFPAGRINVLVIAPHFDDELIGCAGVLAEHVKRDQPCSVLYLTNGKGRNQQQYDSDIRKREARLGLEHLGDVRSLYFDIPDGELAGNPHYRQHLVSELVSNHYERIYFPNPEDSYSDHAYAGEFLSFALHAIGQTPELYAYEIIEPMKFPNIYFEMSCYCSIKAKALKEHVSQHQYLDYTKISLEINKLRGEQLKCGDSEMYRRFSLVDLQKFYQMASKRKADRQYQIVSS